MTKPALCPFCGGTETQFTMGAGAIECTNADCEAVGPGNYVDEEEAIEAWNKRKLTRPSATLRWAAAKLSSFGDDCNAVDELLNAAERLEAAK